MQSSHLCNLVVPAYNEAGTITACLTSVYESPLPSGFAWREWILLDGGSLDGTDNRARSWGAEVIPGLLSIRRPAGARQGLTADFMTLQRELLLDQGRHDEIVVVLEGDSAVLRDSISNLLEPFKAQRQLAAAFGACRASDRSWGHWASAFQIEVAECLARLQNPATPRAMGRLFAYRVGMFRDLELRNDAGGHDNQFASFMMARRLLGWRVSNAIALVSPSAGFHEFSLQTRRTIASEIACHEAHSPNVKRRPPLRTQARAFLSCGLTDPVRAGAYLIARLRLALLRTVRPLQFDAAWERPNSTT